MKIGEKVNFKGEEGTIIGFNAQHDYYVRFTHHSNPIAISASDLEKEINNDYQRGLEDGWNLVKRLFSNEFSKNDLQRIFGFEYIDNIIRNYSPQEALQKIKEDDEKQLNVNDVVTFTINTGKEIGVITRVSDSKRNATVLASDGNTYIAPIYRFAKTGKTVNASEILAQLNQE